MNTSLKVSKGKHANITDPNDHWTSFSKNMNLYDATDASRCKAFPTTLRGIAGKWYAKLASRTITSSKQMKDLFLAQFTSSFTQTRSVGSLFSIKETWSKTLRQFITMFRKANTKVKDLKNTTAL